MQLLPWGKFFMVMAVILAGEALLFYAVKWFQRRRAVRRAGEHLASSSFTWPVQQELLRGPRSITSIATSIRERWGAGPDQALHVVLGVSYAIRAMEVRGEVVCNPLTEMYSLSRGKTR